MVLKNLGPFFVQMSFVEKSLKINRRHIKGTVSWILAKIETKITTKYSEKHFHNTANTKQGADGQKLKKIKTDAFWTGGFLKNSQAER